MEIVRLSDCVDRAGRKSHAIHRAEGVDLRMIAANDRRVQSDELQRQLTAKGEHLNPDRVKNPWNAFLVRDLNCPAHGLRLPLGDGP